MSKPPITMNSFSSFDEGLRSASSAQLPGNVPTLDQYYDERMITEAWEFFLSSGQPQRGGLVRATIQQSWERSVTSGVNAHGKGSSSVTSPNELYHLREKNEDLLVSARAAFRGLAETLGEAATMSVITDRNGIILDVGGSRKTIEGGHDIKLEIGAGWTESDAGTNGIGTALSTGHPVHIHAAEHFCEGVRAWACVGAPVRSPIDGSIIGVIDFSGPQETFHRHSIALATISAQQIELAMADQIRSERSRLLQAAFNSSNGPGCMDGTVIVDRFGRIVHFNDAASHRLRTLAPNAAFRVNGRLLRLDGAKVPKDNLFASLPEELRGQSIEPLIVDGVIKGAMLVLSARTKQVPVVTQGTTELNAMIAAVRTLIIGESSVLLQAIDRTIRAAKGASTILLEGETGVGKELFAQLIHAAGKVAGKEPFVSFNCGAVSKELLGGELFGHAPGAFTGATKEGRPGRFEIAHGGTLSLDEIGEMPLDLQPYLLRVLEERVVYRLGDSKPRPVNVRLVASTNRNLKQEVEEGHFRKDLYYRIAAVKITIPPLRERTGDVGYLVSYFNEKISSAQKREPLRFDSSVMDHFERYDWPGNVRELRNLVESLVLMSTSGMITMDDLPSDILVRAAAPDTVAEALPASLADPLSPRPKSRTLEDAERVLIEQAIMEAGGNVSDAADKLGVARSTIYRKMHHYRMKGSRPDHA